MKSAGKNRWALVLMILAGIVLGSFIATLTDGISWLSWLSFGQTFGFQNPIILDLGLRFRCAFCNLFCWFFRDCSDPLMISFLLVAFFAIIFSP